MLGHLEALRWRQRGGVLLGVVVFLEARGRGGWAEKWAVRSLDSREGRRLAESRTGLGGGWEKWEVGSDSGGRWHQESEFAVRQSAGNKLDVAGDLDPGASVVVLVAALHVALEADLDLGVETLRHVGNVVVVEGRDLLKVGDAVVEVRDETLFDRRVDVLEVVDVARDFAGALGEAGAEFGYHSRVGGYGRA